MLITSTNPQDGGNSKIELFSFQVFPKMLKAERDLKRHGLSFGIEVKNQFEQYLEVEKTWFKRPTYLFVPQCERIFLAAEDFCEANLQTVCTRFKAFFDKVYYLRKSEHGKIACLLSYGTRAEFDDLLEEETAKHGKWQKELSKLIDAQSSVLRCISKAAQKKEEACVWAMSAESSGSKDEQQRCKRIQMDTEAEEKQFRKNAKATEATLPKLATAAEKRKKTWIAFCRKIVKQAEQTSKKHGKRK